MKRVYLEITDACNLDCPFCSYKKGNFFMPYDQVDDYTSQIREFCNYIYLHILGEPLLHPESDRILDLLDRKGFHLQLVTNGTLLNRYPDLLKHDCLRKLSVSVHSYDHSNKDEHYFDTLNGLIEHNNDKTIELRFYNEETLSDTLKGYKASLIEKYGIETTRRSDSFRLKDNVYIYTQDFFDWPSMDHPFVSDTGYCHGGIDMIAINHEGKVCLCCLDPLALNEIGDLNKECLKDILSSDTYLNIVKAFKEKKIVSDLCKHCSYRSRFD